MKLHLQDLIDNKIKEIRYHHTSVNNYHLQEFHAYLKLDSNLIISIPGDNGEVFYNRTPEEDCYLKDQFESGEKAVFKSKWKPIGKTITNFYFSYYENEIDEDQKAFIELDNELYLSEENYGPQGVTNVWFTLLNKTQFETYCNKQGNDVRTFKN